MATVYVSSTGNDSNTYVQAQSSATPWLTIGKANTSATTGDTIVLLNGTLTWENITFTKSFTISGQTQGSAIIDGGGGAKKWIFSTGATTMPIKDIVFQNAIISINNPYFDCQVATLDLQFTRCTFKSINLTSNAGASGIVGQTNGFGQIPNNISFTNCLFYSITTTGANSRYIKLTSWTGTHTASIIGCTFYLDSTTTAHAITLFDFGGTSSLAITMKNNIIANFSGQTITQTVAGGTFTSTYNDNYLITSAIAGTGNITSDPLFVSAADNFNLRPNSPCIGSGTLV